LDRGARHGGEDVCDLSHCARFAGYGPIVAWPRATVARVLSEPDPSAPFLDARAWTRVREAASHDGPAAWTAHCGGESLSERSVWGAGSRETAACSRHRDEPAAWSRFLSDAALRDVFGESVTALEATDEDGVLHTL